MNGEVIWLGLMTVVFTTAGAILLKKAATRFTWKQPLNIYFVAASLAYLFSVIPFTSALRKAELSFVYPFTALQYFCACFAGFILYKEKVTAKKIGGIIVLVLGIFLLGIGR